MFDLGEVREKIAELTHTFGLNAAHTIIWLMRFEGTEVPGAKLWAAAMRNVSPTEYERLMPGWGARQTRVNAAINRATTPTGGGA